VADFCVHEFQRQFFEQLNNRQHFKEDPVSWNKIICFNRSTFFVGISGFDCGRGVNELSIFMRSVLKDYTG
jgi:hypothetical protein